MPRSGPRTVCRYTDEFKLTAVRLSQQPGIQVQSVAAALEIHPFMLSKWRKDVRDGLLRGELGPPPNAAQRGSSSSSKRLRREFGVGVRGQILRGAKRVRVHHARSDPEFGSVKPLQMCCAHS